MSEHRVYMGQLLCPGRHCIMAVAEEFDTAEAAENLRGLLDSQFKDLSAVLPGILACAICCSTDFHIEITVTCFRTIEEARPALFQEEARQLATQMFLKQHRN